LPGNITFTAECALYECPAIFFWANLWFGRRAISVGERPRVSKRRSVAIQTPNLHKLDYRELSGRDMPVEYRPIIGLQTAERPLRAGSGMIPDALLRDARSANLGW
jgi:hypothetical protein